MSVYALNGIDALEIAFARDYCAWLGIKLRTEYTGIKDYPRRCWYALDESTHSGTEAPVGWGNSEVEAILDLVDEIYS